MEVGQLTRPMIEDADTNPKQDQQVRDETRSAVTAVVVLTNLVSLCGCLSAGCILGYTSPAESGIMEELGLSLAAFSMFGSILNFGGMISGLVNGKIADLVGRKPTMWLSGICCTAGWLAIAFGKNAVCLDIGKLLQGVGIGLIGYAGPIHIAEITPKEIRGSFTSAYQLGICCGMAFMYFIGNVVSWRALALLGSIPSALHLVGVFFIPESPRWLAKVGKHEEFVATLQRLRGKNVDVSVEATEIIDCTETFQQNSENFLDLFQQRYAYSLTAGVGLVVLQQLSGNAAVVPYASSIFSKAGSSSKVGTSTMATLQILASAIGVLLTDKLGRRPLLMISAAGMCICSALIGVSFLDLHYLKDLNTILAFLAIQGSAASFVLGMGGLPLVIMSEIFPVNVKGSAGSLITVVMWSFSWIVSYTFNFIMHWSSSGTFFVYSVISGLTVVFVAKLVPETKGRDLEEIQASMMPRDLQL